MKKHIEQSRIIAGCYERLSDDDENDGTSISIETQTSILTNYCRSNCFTIYDHYQDDGFTGTNFNRPSFTRLMNDARNGVINTIIVKDLSRFGRNYLEVGNYLSEVFPRLNVRFIAIGDDVDTDKGSIDYDLMVPIKNIFNEYYPADCSKKVKQAFIAKATNGEYLGSHAPYGYKKSPDDKHVLEIDEVTAPTVLRIFQMAAYQGHGFNKIARVLSAEKILTPSAYQAQQEKKPYLKEPYDWNLTTVYKMFENEAYLGHLISGKRRKVSFKSKRVIRPSEDQWIVVRNTHPAIISQELWDDAHKALGSRKRECQSGFDNIFAGLLKCDKCGYALGLSTSHERNCYYLCNTYKKKGPERCSSHYILHKEIYNAVLADIRETVKLVQTDREAFMKMVLDKVDDADNTDSAKNEREVAALESKIAELDAKFDRLYDDRLSGLLSDRKFKELSEKCEAEQDAAKERLLLLTKETQTRKSKESRVEQFMRIVEGIESVTELDRDILNQLVDRITIGDRIKSGNGARQTIHVDYKFIGKAG